MRKRSSQLASSVFEDWMDVLDKILAQHGVPIHARPLSSAMLFIENAVESVRHEGNVEEISEGESFQTMRLPWFGVLIQEVEDWYKSTYSTALLQRPKSELRGAVAYRDSLLNLVVPVSTSHPAERNYQRWISFPDHIEDDEDVLSWINPPVCREEDPDSNLISLEAQVRQVATTLRFIASRVGNVVSNSNELQGLLKGALKNLEAFPGLAVKVEQISIQKAWWEL